MDSRVCGPHMNFRQVDCEALARTAASPYIKGCGWFVLSLLAVVVVVGREGPLWSVVVRFVVVGWWGEVEGSVGRS